jgi:UDP-N-acetylmuramoylalanine--D-glutamate ligase
MTFPSDLFAGQRFAVVGLGRNGLPAARALAAMGADVVAWDDTAAARAAATGLRVAVPEMAGLDALVLSPGIAHALPAPHPIAAAAREAGVPILSDAELLFRAVRAAGSAARFVGITGTNGKSTTTALVAHLLAESGVPVAAGGNLGPAALALPLLPQDGVYVLEMSSYMLERIGRLRFDAAAMLNLSPDHLDRHGDMAGYAAAKRRVFANQTADDTAVIGADDPDARAMAAWRRGLPGRVITISMHDAVPALPASLRGAHNAQNASAALAVVGAVMETAPRPERVLAALRTFPGLPHRIEHVATIDGVAFVNDSKATNADSAARALACHDRVVWIAGGIAKAGGIEPLAGYFPRIRHALLIGRDADALAATLARNGVPHAVVGTLDAAVPAALALARDTGATVLLSPACASFDQFAGFDARGDRFRELVAALRRAA